jgi:WD40 repeat protein
VQACADTTQIRWNWNAPILVSPHNSDVIFHAGSILLRSPFRGETWQEISPDLTVNDPARRCGSGNIQFATITTIDESPIVPGLLWVGTDDGNVQVTRNGGGTWTNVRTRITGHPGYWVSRVTASHHDPAVAYVTVTGLRNDDFKPYIWKTTDYGQTWSSIAGNLPNSSINVVREDHKNPNLLIVGNDIGVFATIDGGRAWTRLNNGFTTNPVHDLVIHQRENEVVVGTHGRGIYIADITPLQGLTAQAMASDVTLFDLQPTVRWETPPTPVTGSLNYNGQSRPAGVPIHYYLRSAVQGVTVRVFDGARVIAETPAPGAAGFNTVRWNLQQRREVSEAETAGRGGGGRGGRGGAGGGGGGGRGGRGGGAGGVVFPAQGAGNAVLTNVLPGDYRVEVQAGNTRVTKNVMILADVWAK